MSSFEIGSRSTRLVVHGPTNKDQGRWLVGVAAGSVARRLKGWLLSYELGSLEKIRRDTGAR